MWLKDLFPHKKHHCRVLQYGYKPDAFTSPGEGSADRILPHATTLVAELCADREQVDASQRPLIFVCHGLGGLLLKRALAFSASRKKKSVQHLRSIYTSTYAILFLGVPHNGLRKEALLLACEAKNRSPNQFFINLMAGSEMLQEMTDQFAPLMSRFQVFNFWEEVQTSFRKTKALLVEESSAAPPWDDVERCGITATHSNMVKFKSPADSGYRVIAGALLRYARSAARVIRTRWEVDLEYLAIEHRQEAERLLEGPSLHVAGDGSSPFGCNQWIFGHRRPSIHFTGRAMQQKHVREKLGPIHMFDARESHRIFVIYGLGGSGKTQFCLKYVDENKSKYSGVLWIDASSDENAEAGYAHLGQEMGKGASYAAGVHWLSRYPNPWLLILDNADDPDMDILKYIPDGVRGHIIITTRNPNAIMHANAGHLRFRGMDPEEAVDLLLRTASADTDPTSANSQNRTLAQAIATELGFLALAVTQAGATIRSKIYTLERYLQYYLGDRKRMLSRSRVRSADEANIITTWEVPFRRIRSREQPPEYKDAVGLVHVCAFMHFESIPEWIFRRSWDGVNALTARDPSYLGIFHTPSGWNEEATARLRRAIHILSDYSIIDHEPEKGLISLHPVVQGWARDRLDDAEQLEWLARTSAVLTQCVSPHLEASGRTYRRALLPHIESCLTALRSRCPSLPASQTQATEIEKFASVYAENGLWRQAKTLQYQVLGYRLRTLGWRHEDTFRIQRTLAYTHFNLFDLRPAVNMQKQVLQCRWFTRPSLAAWTSWPPWYPDYTSYCVALDDMTMLLWLAGEQYWSNHTSQRAVKGLMKRLGPDDPMTITAMFNLARTQLHLGNARASHRLLLWVIKQRKHYFGLDHPDTLTARDELGMCICAERTNLAAAEMLVTNVLEARKRILGEEHAHTLWSANNLSKVLCERRRPQRAAEILEEALPVVVRTLGEEHIGYTFTSGNLARAYFLLGRFKDAEDLTTHALGLIDEDHPQWPDFTAGYVFLLVRTKRLQEAESKCKALLDKILTGQKLKKSSPRTVAVAQQLAAIYREQGRMAEISALQKTIPSVNDMANNDRFDMMPIRRAMTGVQMDETMLDSPIT